MAVAATSVSVGTGVAVSVLTSVAVSVTTGVASVGLVAVATVSVFVTTVGLASVCFVEATEAFVVAVCASSLGTTMTS